jgi:DNA-binding MarR family transcriptional regulator
MVTGPESRILARLHTFSSTLESAWDVPRDICLPGLSEYLGVVRSALHAPLNELVKKGMVIERKAHVIGGGSRKRKVYHITDLGRAECKDIDVQPKKSVGELLGKPPNQSSLHGRTELIGQLKSKKKIILTGLPGIGKTSLLRGIADELVKEGMSVRFATMESFKDITDIFGDWEYQFSSESAVLNLSKKEVLILDELQEVSQRHLGRLEEFASKSTHLIMASRAPIPISEGFEIVEVPPLEIQDAINLLPEHLENRETVAKRLGGHPLALQMHDEDSDLPESGSDLQEWVRDVVLSKLQDEIKALDELSLLPVPVPPNYLQHEQYLLELDDFALLRWFASGVELHHLVRNVRSTMLTEDDYASAANYWSQLDGDLARLVEMHHVLNSEGDIESLLIRNAESLMVRSSSGLASLIGDAIFRHPTEKLHRIAAMVAIERGEDEIASEHLSHCNAPDLEYSNSLLKGESEIELPKDAGARLLLSEAARRIDDKLPGQQVEGTVLQLIEEIDISSMSEEMRKVVLVAIAHVKHAWHISKENWSEASNMRESLTSISHAKDPQLVAMNLRAEIAQTSGNSPSFDKLIEQAFSHNGLRAKMLQISLLERCDGERAKSILKRIEIPSAESQTNMTSARRVSAMIWYYRAIFKTHNPLSAMAEAISLWKRSLCPAAAKDATQLMHKML